MSRTARIGADAIPPSDSSHTSARPSGQISIRQRNLSRSYGVSHTRTTSSVRSQAARGVGIATFTLTVAAARTPYGGRMDETTKPLPPGGTISFDGERLSVGGAELMPGRYAIGDQAVVEVYEPVGPDED